MVVFNTKRCEVRENDGNVIASGTQVGLYKLNRNYQHYWPKRIHRQNLWKLVPMADGFEL